LEVRERIDVRAICRALDGRVRYVRDTGADHGVAEVALRAVRESFFQYSMARAVDDRRRLREAGAGNRLDALSARDTGTRSGRRELGVVHIGVARYSAVGRCHAREPVLSVVRVVDRAADPVTDLRDEAVSSIRKRQASLPALQAQDLSVSAAT